MQRLERERLRTQLAEKRIVHIRIGIRTENHVRIDMSRLDKKGRWENDPEKVRILPPDTPIRSKCVKIIFDDINTRPEIFNVRDESVSEPRSCHTKQRKQMAPIKPIPMKSFTLTHLISPDDQYVFKARQLPTPMDMHSINTRIVLGQLIESDLYLDDLRIQYEYIQSGNLNINLPTQ